MTRISADISRKVPIPGSEFSSQQFGAAMEIEISDADKPDTVRERIRTLYDLLSAAVDEQIAGAGHHQVGVAPGGNGVAPAPVPQAVIGYSRTMNI